MMLLIILFELVNNTEMKRTQTKNEKTVKLNNSSDIDMDCSCEILYDDELSNVGDSDCDCSDCLSANLNAFNEFKSQNENTLNSTKQIIKNRTSGNSGAINHHSKRNGSTNRHDFEGGKNFSQFIRRNKSSDRFQKLPRERSQKWSKQQNEEMDSIKFEDFREGNQYSNGQLNQFLLITKHRTRKYLEQRKRLQQNEKQQKQNLKQKIKKNLQVLKYTAQIMREENLVKEIRSQDGKFNHTFKWNHSKYKCQCNGKTGHEHAKGECCRTNCRETKIRQNIDTNLANLNQEFKQNKDQFLQNVVRRRKQKEMAQKKQKCKDKCPNHHNRTDKQRIKEIEQMILKNVEKYEKKKKGKKIEQQKKQKKLENKLEALDQKCKQILKRSKIYDPNASKSSFRLSIQQFDTFSQLREEDQRRKKNKKDDLDIKRKIKEGGAQLLQQVYIQEEDEGQIDQFLNPNSKQKRQVSRNKTKQQYMRPQDQIYKRVAYDAKISSPKNMKGRTDRNSQAKLAQTKKHSKNEKKKKQEALNRQKQEQQKKKINEQIEKKKKQIMNEYHKRNTNMPKNEDIRKEYEQKTRPSKKSESKVDHNDEKMTISRDPYRSNYQTRAGKNQEQIRVHGDPLLQQYTYHRQKERSQGGKRQEIFKSNIHGLTSKKNLLP